jgi:bile acid:Na+ symporter, BASS family
MIWLPATLPNRHLEEFQRSGRRDVSLMAFLIPIVVGLLMVSVGMSLSLRELAASLRRLTWLAWLRMLLATFVIPALIALLLARVFRLSRAELAGIFMIGVSPGAPLLTRNLARKGFEMHLAASYQVWAALMIPVMIPILVASAARLYNRDVWISPAVLLWQIAVKQFLPLGLGMVIANIAPRGSKKYQPALNTLGNVTFVIILGLALFKLGPALKDITPILPVVCLLLAMGSISAVWLIGLRDPIVRRTFAICNANRHVGLALLLSSQYLHATRALPAIACYALIAPLVMIAYAWWYRDRTPEQKNPEPEAKESPA